MIRKKQVLTVVSIAAISFLVGTMFSVMATDGGNPFSVIWEAISGLESRVEALEEQSQPQGFMSAPAYDSGWMALSPGGIICEHNLGTYDLFVYVVGRWEWSDAHQLLYGGIAYYYEGDWYNEGAWWHALSIDEILVNRGTEDVRWEEVRVYIWIIP